MLAPLDLSRFFEQHPVLETPRLLLRQLMVADAADMFEYHRDPECVRYIPLTPAQSVAETEAWIGRIIKDYEAKGGINFGIELKAAKKIIGSCELHRISVDHHRAGLGYGLAKKYWGFGYTTEAASELIRFAFDELELHRIEASCDPRNTTSIRVAEKCGLTYEATFREEEICKGERLSNAIYAIIR